MDDRNRSLHRRVGQVRVELLDLVRQQEPLVDDGPAGEAQHVEVRPRVGPDRVLDQLSDDEQLALEGILVQPGSPQDEDLADLGAGLASQAADRVRLHGNVAPAEQVLAFLDDDRLDALLAETPLLIIAGQKEHAHPVLARNGQPQSEPPSLLLEEAMGHLHENPRPVAGLRIAPRGAAVREVDEYLQALLDELVRLTTVDVADEADPARVVFEAGIVESLACRRDPMGHPPSPAMRGRGNHSRGAASLDANATASSLTDARKECQEVVHAA